jgi:hypothetical protein
MRLFLVYWSVVLAYLDAGTGSMIIQAAVAAIVTIPFLLRSYIRRAIARVRGDRTEQG